MSQVQTDPLFSAHLVPYRSLGRTGIWLVVIAAGMLALIPGTIFFLLGAWPVLGFLGLDVLALAVALSISLGEVRRREEITLWRDRLEVRHVPPSGAARRHRFNPFWVRFSVKRDVDERVTGLLLASRGRELEIGGFLGPEAKAEFARDFSAALYRARN